MLISGSCHCGNVSFTLDWQPDPTEIPARACGCSFCTKHGGVWTSCPTGHLRIRVRRPERVAAYEFGTRTAQPGETPAQLDSQRANSLHESEKMKPRVCIALPLAP